MQLENLLEEQRKIRDMTAGCEAVSDAAVALMLFRLGDERFASPIDAVREVIDAVPIVPYPERDRRHLGVINLRGSIVPVLELRPELGTTERARIIIFEDEAGHPFAFGADEVWKTETTDGAVRGGGSMLRIDDSLVRLVGRHDLVAITEDGHG